MARAGGAWARGVPRLSTLGLPCGAGGAQGDLGQGCPSGMATAGVGAGQSSLGGIVGAGMGVNMGATLLGMAGGGVD